MCGKNLFCFCKFCIDGGNGPCENYTHVKPWDLVTLEPCSSIDARCDLDIDDMREVFHDGESLAACLEVGNYFAIATINDVENDATF
jgi:hypothetical protein